MTTSKILQLTRQQILDRARGCLGDDVKYRLPYPNGGTDPTTPKPYAKVKIDGHVFNVADCIGFALWASGISRRFTGTDTIPPFPDTPSVVGSYINCSSLVEEVQGFPRRTGQPPYKGGRFFKQVFVPELGDIIVFPSRTVRKGNPKNGHIGIVSEVPTEAPLGALVTDNWITRSISNRRGILRVIHCSSGNYKRFGRAVAETDANVWRGRGAIFCRLNCDTLFRGAV